jgi:Uma2 family endonuclease
MSRPAGFHRYTYADYLALEAASNVKHEFLAGEIYGMAGGTPEHAALSVAVSSALLAQLRGGPSRVYSSDLRVRVLATGLATYPDVTVVCGDAERDPESPTTVVNPRLVVEVLSDSTVDYDRGEKLHHYRQIPSLQGVVLVWHTQRRIEIWTRGDGGTWTARDAFAGERAPVPGLSCALIVNDVYRDALGPS